MVAARKLEQKQLIEVHLLHRFEGMYPNVPIAEGVDFEGLVQPDIDAGDEPFFITLPLAEFDQISKNGRQYSKAVAVNAIHEAIQKRRITGQLGHTAEERRGWEFKIPALHWVGSQIVGEGDKQVVWGKAYIPRTAMDLREYYRLQMRKNAAVGTSLEGMGFQEYDDELEMFIISDLEVHRIDAVSAEGVGIPKAGSMPPNITSESKKQPVQEAEAGEIQVGDLVQWDNRNNLLMRGKVNTIWDDGEVEVPYSDSPPLMATADNPLCRMDVYEPHYDTGAWRRVGWQEIQFVRDVTKIDVLPEIAPTKPNITETAALARMLNDAIGGMVDDDTSEADVIDRMASAAGIEAGTVRQILNNEIDKPPLERLRGFADVLDVSFEDLADAAGYTEDEIEQEMEQSMSKTTEKTDADRLQELETQHQQALAEMQAKLDEAQRKGQKAEATLINVRKGLSLAEDADVVDAVQAVVAERETLRNENQALLETAIAGAITENAKIIHEALQSESAIAKVLAGTVRTLINQRVQAENISKKAEVEGKVKDVIGKEDVQDMLKELRGVVMGPNVTTPMGDGKSEDPDDQAVTY